MEVSINRRSLDWRVSAYGIVTAKTPQTQPATTSGNEKPLGTPNDSSA
jgi:hypothetical protein